MGANVNGKSECPVGGVPNGTATRCRRLEVEPMITKRKKKRGCCDRIEDQLQHLGKGTTWLAIFLGQVTSALLCASAVVSVYIIDTYHLRIPNAQNFAFYLVLSAVFTTTLACRPGERNLFPVLRTRGWKYFLLAMADALSNYLFLRAYQFTTLTSGQLLDCFAIPVILSLSWLILRIRFKVPHILGVFVSLLGLCCLVWADIEDGRPLGPGKDRFLGDMLCLTAALLRGVSNVCEEFIVKTFDKIEFLGMIGLFGSFLCGLQCLILEYGAVSSMTWVNPHQNSLNQFALDSVSISFPITTETAFIIAYALCQVILYVITASVIKMAGATFLNLSLLTADFYSLIVGMCLFQIKFHALYFLSFVLVMTGVIMFSIKPTLIATDIYRTLTRDQTATTTLGLDLELMASTSTSTVLPVPLSFPSSVNTIHRSHNQNNHSRYNNSSSHSQPHSHYSYPYQYDNLSNYNCCQCLLSPHGSAGSGSGNNGDMDVSLGGNGSLFLRESKSLSLCGALKTLPEEQGNFNDLSFELPVSPHMSMGNSYQRGQNSMLSHQSCDVVLQTTGRMEN